MINIVFFQSGDIYTGFEARGHAMSAENGQDVICAFVSSACYMAANTVTDVLGLKAQATQSDGYMRLKIQESPQKAQDILKGMHLHLAALRQEYPENITVMITEESPCFN